MSGRTLQRYNKYHQWWKKTEKIILRLTIIFFAVLYALQLLNFVMEQRGAGPLSATVGKLEGIPVADSQTQINMGTLELTVTSKSDCSMIEIYLNGEYHASFEKKSISLNVKNNDIIEVSGVKSEYPATIKITSVTDNMVSPQPDKTVKVARSFVTVGRIRLK